jgi:hypothetical protein
MPSREQIARIIEPLAFDVVQSDIDYYHQIYIKQNLAGNVWTPGPGGWTQLANNLRHNIAWQEVAQAWDKADQILDAFQKDEDDWDPEQIQEIDDGYNIYRRLLKKNMGE